MQIIQPFNSPPTSITASTATITATTAIVLMTRVEMYVKYNDCVDNHGYTTSVDDIKDTVNVGCYLDRKE